METPKFTPSPWNYDDPDGKVRDESGGVVATIWNWTNPETRDANARLIAAAPDLYDALRAMVALYGTVRPDYPTNIALAALSKATDVRKEVSNG